MPRALERTAGERVLQLVSAIHAAPLRPDGWHDVLERMRRMFGIPYAAFMTRTDDFAKRSGIAAGVSAREYQEMLDTYFVQSVYLKKPTPQFTGQIIASRDMAQKKEVLESAIYQGWNRDRDVHEMLRLTLRAEGGVSELITLGQPWSAGAFQPAVMRMCRMMMPHLQSASLIADRLRGADLFAHTALAGLDLLGHAVLLLDPAARLFHANALGDEMLSGSGVIRAVRGTLQAATPAQTTRLHAAFAAALGVHGIPRASHFRLAKPGGGAPLIVLVLPIEQEASWAILHRPALMVCITDPESGTAIPSRHLAELFGLTPAESILAEDLLAGYELAEIAQRQGRSIHTLRTHLARLMAKTDVDRQTKLLRLLSAIPRVR